MEPKKSRSCCTFPHCVEPKDIAAKSGLCSTHHDKWIQSYAFSMAIRDRTVRLAAQVLGQTAVMRELAKHRRRWAKEQALKQKEGC